MLGFHWLHRWPKAPRNVEFSWSRSSWYFWSTRVLCCDYSTRILCTEYTQSGRVVLVGPGAVILRTRWGQQIGSMGIASDNKHQVLRRAARVSDPFFALVHYFVCTHNTSICRGELSTDPTSAVSNQHYGILQRVGPRPNPAGR